MAIEATDLDRLVELGLFDPDDPEVADIIEYLEFLASEGFDVVELARKTSLEHFGAITAAASLRPDVKDLSEHGDIGMDPAELAEMARAFGFDRSIVNSGRYTSREIEVLRAAAQGAELFSEVETQYFAQVTGASLARMAEAAVSLFMVDFEVRLNEQNLSRTESAIQSNEATGNLQVVLDALDPMFRVHMGQAILRIHHAADQAESPHGVRQAVGFVDLVGFTTLSASLSMAHLSVLVREFEARAHQLVSEAGARVVKSIGDAVMFTAVDPDSVADAAVALLGQFGDRAHVAARGGLTYGDVLIRGGDYYGPVVNLAARLGDLAVPGELLATRDFTDALGGDLSFEPAGRRQLKGFAEPVATVSWVA
ncbi:MAG: adenylate/guanylate cyclase domain-containing protein [Acidimicrobiales bacterium]